MRTALKWIGIGLGALVGLILLAVGAVYALSEARFNRTYDIQVEPVEIPADPESIAYGEHIASIRGCKACHGDDLSGQIEFQDPMVGVIANANLTGGRGSEVIGYTVENWDRAIRHGIGPDGKPLLIMPSRQHNVMSDEDLGALLAYIQSLPPVDNELPELELSLLIRAFYVAGRMEGIIVPAEAIDHDAPRLLPRRAAQRRNTARTWPGCAACATGRAFPVAMSPVCRRRRTNRLRSISRRVEN